MKQWLPILHILMIFLNMGCSKNIVISKDAYNHMIALDKNGSPYSLQVEEQNSDSYDFETQISDIQSMLKDHDEILIYIHGGMVPIGTSIEGVENILDEPYWKKNENAPPPFPIFVNWESGIVDAYLDHLSEVRQGTIERVWGRVTALLYLIADLGRAITRTPLVLQQQIHNVLPFQDETPRGLSKQQKDPFCPSSKFQKNNGVSACIDPLNSQLDWAHIVWQQMINVVPGVLRIITTPLLDTMGKSSWHNMTRRTQTIFLGQENKGHPRSDTTSNYETGGLTKLLDKLRQENQTRKRKLEITLIGHSMGAIVLNEIIRRYPDLNYKNIVYLAGAATIKDFQDSVIPYMKSHVETEFFNTTLHPFGDRHEPNYYVLPQGSLLDWIDDFASEPRTRLDHTIGKWNNIFRVMDDLDIPADIKGNPIACRIKIRGFGFDSKYPMMHGDMNNLNVLKDQQGNYVQFWMRDFWELSPVFPPGSISSNIATCKSQEG